MSELARGSTAQRPRTVTFDAGPAERSEVER
jgi:hypothetical protein